MMKLLTLEVSWRIFGLSKIDLIRMEKDLSRADILRYITENSPESLTRVSIPFYKGVISCDAGATYSSYKPPTSSQDTIQ